MSDTYLIPQFIIDYLQKSKSTKNPQKLAITYLRKHKTPEIEKWFKENEVTAGYIWKYFVFYGLNKFSFRECLICGNRIKLSTIMAKPDVKYCSTKCANSSEEKKKNIKQTCLEKYGVEHPSQLKENREKAKQTCLVKYGVENPSQCETFQEKIKQTSLKRYGVERPQRSEIIKEKAKQTCLVKYGVENPFQVKEIQEKIKQTSLERYGFEQPLQAEEIKEKAKQTFIEKYGVENPAQANEVKEKFKKTRKVNHWKIFSSLLKEKDIVPLFSKEEYINNTGRKFRCLVCGEEFVSEGTCNYLKEHKNKDGTYSILKSYYIFCPFCHKSPTSKKEKEVLEFVKTIYKGEISENHKGLFPNKNMELDIYLPSLNLGIEFDGDYWHSKEGAQERDERKNQLCEEKGIHLIRIKEEDWDTDKEKVKEEIKKYIL